MYEKAAIFVSALTGVMAYVGLEIHSNAGIGLAVTGVILSIMLVARNATDRIIGAIQKKG